VISPKGSLWVVCAQSLSPLGRRRLCLARTSQSTRVPSCWTRAINGIRSASQSATYARRVSRSVGTIRQCARSPRSSAGFPSGCRVRRPHSSTCAPIPMRSARPAARARASPRRLNARICRAKIRSSAGPVFWFLGHQSPLLSCLLGTEKRPSLRGPP